MAPDRPKFPQAQSVMTFTAPVLREPSRDDVIVRTLRSEFPNVISRPMGQSAAPNAPLVLASKSSQLSIGPGQAELGVGFYGSHLTNLDGAIGYLRKKVGTILSTLSGVDAHVLTVGVVLVVQFPFGAGSSQDVLGQLLETQIRDEVLVADVADVQVRLGLKVSDTYYVSLAVNNYESRSFQGVASPASPMITIRPWEGDVTELGIQLVIDVNDRLRVRQAERDTPLDEAQVGKILDVVAAVAAGSGPTFVETGRVSSADIEASLGTTQ